jgi:hypothetical protein
MYDDDNDLDDDEGGHQTDNINQYHGLRTLSSSSEPGRNLNARNPTDFVLILVLVCHR